MIAWIVEDARTPAFRPTYLAVDAGEVLVWTADLALAMRFTERHHAERFVHNRLTVPVVLVDLVIDEPVPSAAAARAARRHDDDLDALLHRQATAALAPAA